MTAIGTPVPIDGDTRAHEAQPRSRFPGVPGLGRITSGWRPLSLVLLVSLLVRIPFIPLFAYLPDGSLDESDWKGWMQALHEHGFLNIFRDSHTNYVGYHWVLWPLSLVYGWFGGTYGHGNGGALHVLVKAPIIGFDMLLICVVYAATSLVASHGAAPDAANSTERATKLALIAALVIALQPGAIYDSAVWPNTDSLAAASMLAAIVLAFQCRFSLAGAVWVFGFLMKPQPIVVLPLLLLIAFRRDGLRAILGAGLAGAAVGLVMTGPWLLHGDLLRILKVYRLLFHDRAPVLSWSAWNLWRFWDATVAPAADDRAVFLLTYRTIGLGMCAVAGSIALGYAWIRNDLRGLLVAGAYLVFAFYVLPVTTHERYLFPFLGLLLPVAMVERRWLWIYVPVSALFFCNLVAAAPPIKSWDGTHIHNPVFLAGAALNVLMFLIYTGVLAPTAWSALDDLKASLARRLSISPA
jgi:hypothetical protein